MSLSEFVENLDGMHHGIQYPKELLKACYLSIKNQPFIWARYTAAFLYLIKGAMVCIRFPTYESCIVLY